MPAMPAPGGGSELVKMCAGTLEASYYFMTSPRNEGLKSGAHRLAGNYP